MYNTIVGAGAVGAGAASRYGSGSGSGQKMRLHAAPAPQHWFRAFFPLDFFLIEISVKLNRKSKKLLPGTYHSWASIPHKVTVRSFPFLVE
jgi:hypothetical protein